MEAVSRSFKKIVKGEEPKAPQGNDENSKGAKGSQALRILKEDKTDGETQPGGPSKENEERKTTGDESGHFDRETQTRGNTEPAAKGSHDQRTPEEGKRSKVTQPGGSSKENQGRKTTDGDRDQLHSGTQTRDDTEPDIQDFMKQIQRAKGSGFECLQSACNSIKDKLPPLVLHEDIDFSSNKIDTYSQKFVPVTKASAYRALKTAGDGNCFFRAASILAFGHQGKHEEMRLRTVVELATNSEFYLQDKDNERRIVAQEQVFIQSSEKNSVKIDRNILKTEFETDVLTTASLSTRASDWHLQALGTVLNRQVQSVFPECGRAEAREYYDAPFCPRRYDPEKDCVTIMWTRTGGDTTPFIPNHFIPLISVDKIDGNTVDGREEEAEENTDESDQEISIEETDKQEKNLSVLRPRDPRSSRLSTNVLDIPGYVYRTVCIKLNSKDDIFLNDYRMLCEDLGYEATVARSLEQPTTSNPTDELLWNWSEKDADKATVEKLIDLLKEEDLERMDVVEILEGWVQKGPYSRLSTRVIDIPRDIKAEICCKLNIEDSFYRGYRTLAQKLDYTRDDCEGLKQGKADPTDTLIKMWSKRDADKATVEKLIDLLKDEDLKRMDVVEIIEGWVQEGPYSRLSTRVIDIPRHIKGEICRKLNIENIFYRDYRMLAEKLNYGRDYLEGLKQGKADPTDTLIKMWCNKNGPLTVSKLIELLKEKREDVVMILENWVNGLKAC
ncbi:uncharacterized protein LOC122948815 isoform X1 [Acropora millepora]|uniref:uncharacterized protein LOC122948815 isoform X1 n=1 Tax=Acropora millepora TaxID=45264 RepID=UPI001CF364B4|nr:uncharacterized protein LOC122948815 isoform X1 [Acropora millepora]